MARMDPLAKPSTEKPDEELGRRRRVPAEEGDAFRIEHRTRAGEHLKQNLFGFVGRGVFRDRDERERVARVGAGRVEIGHRVHRGDPAHEVGIVDERAERIDARHDDDRPSEFCKRRRHRARRDRASTECRRRARGARDVRARGRERFVRLWRHSRRTAFPSLWTCRGGAGTPPSSTPSLIQHLELRHEAA